MRAVYLTVIVLSVLALAGITMAQDAPKPVSALVTFPPVSAQELVAAYRQTRSIQQQRVADHQTRLVATPEYKAFEEVRQQLLKIEADLGAKVLAKTGKTIVWTTGELK